MYNLLGNAVKFSKDGGVIDLSISLVSPEKDVRADGTKTGTGTSEDHDNPSHQIRFRVKDYGTGIDKKNFSKIFQPFSQADKETQSLYGGTGLGLAISSKLANALGGNISVDSALGEWTEFTVDIPFEGTPVDTSAIRMQLQSIHIFCVMQDANIVAHIRAIMEEFQANFSIHPDLPDVDACLERESLLAFKLLVYLVDERLYSSETFEHMKARVPCRLFTFGPSLSVAETEGHFRSITHVFPSVLTAKLALMGESRKSPRMSTRFSMIRRSFSSIKTAGSSDDSEMANSLRRSFQSMSQTMEPSLSPLRVMIAEDNLINQKVLLRLLKRVEVEDVTVVDTGAKAVELEAANAFDVIFMDYQMPVMDGVEACRRISRRAQGSHPPAKVVFVTANASTEFETECYEAGCVDFLPKPFNVRDIEALLQSLFS